MEKFVTKRRRADSTSAAAVLPDDEVSFTSKLCAFNIDCWYIMHCCKNCNENILLHLGGHLAFKSP